MDAIKEGMLASAKAAKAAARIGERLFCQNTPNVMKFTSQICTTRVQSERLLALGLKKETADMHHSYYTRVSFDGSKSHFWKEETGYSENAIPAWSLHRLIEMMPQIIGHFELAVNDAFVGYYEDRCESETGMYWEYTEESSNLYDNIISTIEWLIKEGYFPKEYLEEMSHD